MSYADLANYLKALMDKGLSKEELTKEFLRKKYKLSMRKRLYVLRRIYNVRN